VPAASHITEPDESTVAEPMDEETLKRYEEACRQLDKKLKGVAKEIRESERLTRDDFAIRINAR
jgi:DNA-binding transcriptional regulator YiaG